jgi:heme-degrading monooxygenase HmoA
VFARVHVLQTTPEQSEAGLQIFREQLLPWLRDASGYRGLIRLVDKPNGKTLVISLWADEESLQASTEAGERLAELTAENVGATRLGLEQYEATIFDL